MNRFLLVLLMAALGLSLNSCVTTKSKKDDQPSKLKKRYHNLTLHYNYWFNANELFDNSIVKLNDQVKENYNQVLPVYPYKALEPSASKSDMESVIKKAATGIGLHRYSAWADDAYLLVGAGQYVKKDYETAESTFRYIKEEYSPTAVASKKAKTKKGKKAKQKEKAESKKKEKKKKETAKKKKAKAKKKATKKKKSSKKGKSKGKSTGKKTEKSKEPVKQTDPKVADPKEKDPEKDEPIQLPIGTNPYRVGLFKKWRTAYPESMIWYARTLTEREKYLDADFQIREIYADPHLPKRLKDELGLAQADLYITQKKYQEAIEPLEMAIEHTRSKKKKARLYYILSQLYDKTKNTAASYAALDKAAKYAPNFELAFNAQLKKVLAGWESGAITAAQADNTLNKMAKETKNSDYRDQIYFTLASVALKNKQKDEAIAYLKESLAYSTENQTQKAESYYTLAELYFNSDDFINAKLYYDSTLTALSSKDERFKKVKDYAESLTDISKFLNTIAANDSIIRVFRMSPSEREGFAKDLKKRREDEATAAAAAKDTSAAKTAGTTATLPIAGLKVSSFYFYNDAFVRKGKRDFERLWGTRPLEDNWRRKNRIGSGAIADGTGTDTKAAEGKDSSSADVTQILSGLPGSEAELEVLLLNNYDAMFQLGKAFRDKLERNDRCVATLEDMMRKYPAYDRYEAETWYYCHVAHRDLSNAKQAQYYLDLLTDKHAKSPFALSLTDPNFSKYGQDKERDLNLYYERIFAAYDKDQFKAALELIQAAPPKFGTQHVLIAKFMLIKAMCVGNIEGTDAYCKELKSVIGTYPDSPESVRAKEIARLISCEGYKEPVGGDKKSEPIAGAEPFTTDDDKIHYFLVVLHSADIKINDVKASMTDYCTKNNGGDGLKISNIFLGTDVNNPIMVVRKFDNKTQAMKFYQAVVADLTFTGESEKKTYKKEMFPVTQENYRRILKNRSIDGYEAFFLNNYFK
jgi:tetratricopeptide (TPR) repeat protein